MTLLSLKGIGKSYQRGSMWDSSNRVDVLKNVNLSIAPGACLGLIGRSGAGKSTLSRIVLGLERPDTGEVDYDGVSLTKMTREQSRGYRRNCQVVFQNSLGSVNPRFTAGQVIAEPLHNFESMERKQVKQRIDDLLEKVGLHPSDADKYPHQFSGGELQRVCIARAIALNPRLIVLDEAVSSLDMVIQSKIITLLKSLQKTMGIAYLFISHDIRVLLKMADTLAVLHEGTVVETVDLKKSEKRSYHPALTELVAAVLPPVPVVCN
ncbi:ABC transporter ATP-binding protein [Desulfosarcina variabilis]|uniref:ABC transporter ATP-binding protein n=1 Tax=Desulfosarcina variabilis TaxID=2300 RepID=UPI003AFB7895